VTRPLAESSSFLRHYLADLGTTIWQHWRSARYTQTAMSRYELDTACRE